jgi:hypothetical protein
MRWRAPSIRMAPATNNHSLYFRLSLSTFMRRAGSLPHPESGANQWIDIYLNDKRLYQSIHFGSSGLLLEPRFSSSL